MEEILAKLPSDGAADITGAIDIYTNGGASKSIIAQKLKDLATPGASTTADDEWWPVYEDYWGNDNNYADTFVQNAASGTLPEAMKKELIKKGIAYQGVWMYAVHSFDKGMRECNVGYWDRGMAYYIGSLEGEYETSADYESTGNLLYFLAQKRCAEFGTCATATDPTTIAAVNKKIQSAEYAGDNRDRLYRAECTDARIATAFDGIVSQMTVPLVQGLLKYAWKADPANGADGSCGGESGNDAATVGAVGDDNCAKSWAEGWAFAAAVLPQIHKCDVTAAATIRDNLDIAAAEPMKDGVAAVKAAVEGVYGCLGIICSDVGEFQSSTGVYAGMEACPDPPAPAPTPSPQTPRPTFCQFSNCADSNSAVPMSDAAARRAGEVAGAALAGAALAFIA